ncbi:SNARE domain protein (macronuclear) [Tetrahymena thermophila SB210]|uniref:SNARE domain protein n=1 Tax=Tetrahymena thermophila (strain SB210) TaxID=312017 RepID=Q24H85_TETTS|nr:SNARE domain protein [Tetrahymena thermophila SB210]EAS07140.2 SNARE domain protein [Tetrahymena thermophila SB210]|eukprot:XP_001027382.2 SNARE domain protein [Tetrahymena thermophila SB210]
MADSFEKIAQQLSRSMNALKAKIQRTPILQPRDKNDIKQDIQEHQQNLDELNNLILSYERNNNKFNLTQNQIQQRKQEVQRLIGLKNEILNIIDGQSTKQMKQDLFNQKQEPKTFKDNYAQPGTSTKQIQQNYQDLQKDQDKHIDKLNENLVITKGIAIQIGQQVEEHIEVLDDIESNVDKGTQKMLTTTGKMKNLIQESKTWGILIGIFAEIAILVLIIIYIN